MPPPPPQRPPESRYPAWFDVEYRQPLSRLSTFFRLFLLVPGLLMLSALNYAIVLFLVVARVAILFRRKYPVWMYSAVAGFLAWHGRLYAYAFLLTDQFPSLSTEPQNAVKLGYDVPEQGSFSRWNGIIWRSIICIPHFIAVGFLIVVAVPLVSIVAWFAILFTGAYPRGFFNFVTGVVRWWFRVTSYVFALQDRFPPFSMSAEATHSSQGARTVSAIGGGVLAAAIAAVGIFAIVGGNRPYVEEISYAGLADESDSVTTRVLSFGDDDGPSIDVTLTYVLDPGEDFIPILIPARDERVVVFEWDIRNRRSHRVDVDGEVAWFEVEYEDSDGDDRTRRIPATIVTVTNSAPPVAIPAGGRVFLYAVFVVPEDAEPVSLRFRTSGSERPIRYEFD